MNEMLFAILLSLAMAILRQVKGPQMNSIRELVKNLIASVIVGWLVFNYFGFQPVFILAAAYAGNDLLMSILERYDFNELEGKFIEEASEDVEELEPTSDDDEDGDGE